jgi:chitinase
MYLKSAVLLIQPKRWLTKKRLTVASALLLGAGLAAVPATAAQADHGNSGAPDKVVSAYFADWDIYGRNYHVKDIPANKINVIQYAFGKPTFDATTGTPGCAVIDSWADYQAPQTAGNSVDGVPDNAADPNQHLYGNFNQLVKF